MTVAYVPLIALGSSVKIGSTTISASTPTLVDISRHTTELQQALAGGKVMVADKVTTTATGLVVTDGGRVTKTPGEFKVDASAGHLYDREKEETKAIAAKAKLTVPTATHGKDRLSLVKVKAADGAVTLAEGTLAAIGAATAPAAGTGYVGLATVFVSGQTQTGRGIIVITDVRPQA